MEDSTVFDTWIMAYHKDYCKKLDPKSLTRKDYNLEYNAVTFDNNKLFKDIEEVVLLLNEENKIKFIERQTMLGYICEKVNNCIICKGPGITFVLAKSADRACKLSRLRISLNSQIDGLKVYKFGNSTLELENKTATWTFK